jgi:cytochrome d ubiquinol oxidase subunit II
MVRAFRRRALGAGVVAGACALGALPVLRSDARHLYDRLTEGPALALVVVSAVAGVGTLALLWRERYAACRLTAVLAVGAIVAGWGLAQRPAVLPGQLTIDQAAAAHATLVAIVVSVGVGLLVLLPSLAWLYRLSLAGRLDAPFEPFGEDGGPEPGPRP